MNKSETNIENISSSTPLTINNIENGFDGLTINGRMNPTFSTLEKIANALGISSSELLK